MMWPPGSRTPSVPCSRWSWPVEGSVLFEMIYAGTKRWTQKHYALLKQRKRGTPMSLEFHNGSWRRMCQDVEPEAVGASGTRRPVSELYGMRFGILS
jgi:hypothetical protein